MSNAHVVEISWNFLFVQGTFLKVITKICFRLSRPFAYLLLMGSFSVKNLYISLENLVLLNS